ARRRRAGDASPRRSRRPCAPAIPTPPWRQRMHDDATATALEQLRDRYQQLLDRLEDNQSQFQRLARSALRVQEDERRRIARELHDGIGQNLTAIKHQLAVLRAQLPANASAEAERLGACIELCAQTLEDTRQLS